MKTKRWIIAWFLVVAMGLLAISGFVYYVDPYFHYHQPHTEKYYYRIDNSRSQNHGISKHFEYEALITGTSMTENFLTSEAEEVLGVKTVKVPSAGATYKEINDTLKTALKHNPNIKMIIRGLDTGMFFDEASRMRWDLGDFPDYLYDENPFNDVYYLFNKDVIFGRAYQMTLDNDLAGFVPGITSFDNYGRWQGGYIFGKNSVAPEGIQYAGPAAPVHLTQEEKATIYENITQNVTSLASEYPNVDFYYFFTPYSILWYKNLVESGGIYKQLEAEQYIIELILQQENIKLFSFNDMEPIVADINNYKDEIHYATWINSYILRCMEKGQYRLTRDNYKGYLERESQLYMNYDYVSLNGQEDYDFDYYAAALFNERIWNAKPIHLLEVEPENLELSGAELMTEPNGTKMGIRCKGSLGLSPESEVPIEEYIRDTEYIGAKIKVEDIKKHNYLTFVGRRLSEHGQPTVVVCDENNNIVGQIMASYENMDEKPFRFLIDITEVEGDITVYLNGGYVNSNGSPESQFLFTDIILY